MKFLAVALLGMVALAAAVDVAPQKKYDAPHYDGPEKDYGYGKHANIEAYHKDWTLLESYENSQYHPCDDKYEIAGSTVAYHGELTDKDNEVVGMTYWSGIVVKWDECAHCKKYKSTGYHVVKTNYEVIFEFEGKHAGQLITKVNSGSIFSADTVVMAVLGGTGPFQGAWGTVTWSSLSDSKGKYEFNIWIPKIVDHDYDYQDGYYYYKGGKKC